MRKKANKQNGQEIGQEKAALALAAARQG